MALECDAPNCTAQPATPTHTTRVPSHPGDSESLPLDFRTDSLVKAVCSAVEDAIKKHHAMFGCPNLEDTGIEQVSVPNKAVVSTSSSMIRFAVSSSSTSRATRESDLKLQPVTRLKPLTAIDMIHSQQVTALDEMQHVSDDRWLKPLWRHRLTNFISSKHYEGFLAVAIAASAVCLGLSVAISASRKTAKEDRVMFIVEAAFAIFFLFELLLRIAILGLKFFISDEAAWNWFDFIVVVAACLRSTVNIIFPDRDHRATHKVLNIMRMGRAMRVARLVRAFRFVRPLRRLLSGIVGTLSNCFWALLLLVLIIYIFGVAFTEAAIQHLYGRRAGRAATHQPDQIVNDTYFYFGNLNRSVDTLFQAVAGGVSWGDPLKALRGLNGTGDFFVLIFYCYISFTYFAVLNVVTALFCQVAIESSLTDQELAIASQMKERQYVRTRLLELFVELDDMEQSSDSPQGMFTLDELSHFISSDSVQARFSVLGIEPEDAQNLFTLLDADAGGLVSAEEFVNGCMKLRGRAQRIDVSVLMQTFDAAMTRLDTFMQQIALRLACGDLPCM